MRINRLSDKQRMIAEFANDPNKRYLICDGAVRSGKTICMGIAFIMWAMAHHDGCDYAICGKTVANAERNVVLPLMQIDGLKRYLRYSRSLHCLTVSVNGRTNRFYLFGGKDESSYELIQGITLAGVLLDEVALMPRSFVDQALARTLTFSDRKVWFNCNPESQLHWFNTEWIQPTDNGERDDVTHIHFLMSDNPIMTERMIEDASAMFSGVFYQRYIQGLWVMADGLIYDMFDRDRHTGKAPETEGEYYVSCDYGIQNATVFLLWRKEKGTQRWCCLNEYYYSGRNSQLQKTVDGHADGLEQMLDGIVPKAIIIDPSASALIVELRKRKYHVLSANNDVLDGISDVSTMLRNDRIFIDSKCKYTIEEFGVYCWDKKAADRGEDRPIKENDHCMDAVRYMVKTKRLIKPKKEYVSLF